MDGCGCVVIVVEVVEFLDMEVVEKNFLIFYVWWNVFVEVGLLFM